MVRVCVFISTFIVVCPTHAITPFVETFSGEGEYFGFDTPGWAPVDADRFEDGGLIFDTFGLSGLDEPPGWPFDSDGMRIRHEVGHGAFVNRIEIRRAYLGDIPTSSDDNNPHSSGEIRISHRLAPGPGNFISISLLETERNQPGEWHLGSHFGGFSVPVMTGENIALETRFNSDTLEVLFGYDWNTLDDEPIMLFGPYLYEEEFDGTYDAFVDFLASYDGHSDGLVDLWETSGVSDIPGDFDGNKQLDIHDIDRLITEVRSGMHRPSFDLTADGVVDRSDVIAWVHDLKGSYFGDANLDGEFASSDLVNVFAAGEYEDDIELNSTWETGDWDGDGDFTTSDLVLAFQDGGYEQGPRAAQSVPEPTALAGAVLGLLWLASRRRKTW